MKIARKSVRNVRIKRLEKPLRVFSNMSEHRKRGRKRGSAPTESDREKAARLYSEIGGTVDSQVYFGPKEIADYLKTRQPEGAPSPSGLSKIFNIDNLDSIPKDNRGRDITWCGSSSGFAYPVLLWWDQETCEFINGSNFPREKMGDNVKSVVSDHDLNRFFMSARTKEGERRKIQAARAQGGHGNEAPAQGAKTRGRPPKHTEQ